MMRVNTAIETLAEESSDGFETNNRTLTRRGSARSEGIPRYLVSRTESLYTIRT